MSTEARGRCRADPVGIERQTPLLDDSIDADVPSAVLDPPRERDNIVSVTVPTEDDGTARDKVTRVQHLGTLSTLDRPADQLRLEVVACIAGPGLGVRREDMKKLLLSTRDKVFTLQNMRQLVEHTRLADFRPR